LARLGVHKVRRRLAASSNEKIQDFSAILRWPGPAYTKYAIALPPRLAKKSLICFRHTWSKRYSFAWSDEKQLVPTGPAPFGIQDGERSLVIKHRRSSDGAQIISDTSLPQQGFPCNSKLGGNIYAHH
jgi:hypothetical protein